MLSQRLIAAWIGCLSDFRFSYYWLSAPPNMQQSRGYSSPRYLKYMLKNLDGGGSGLFLTRDTRRHYKESVDSLGRFASSMPSKWAASCIPRRDRFRMSAANKTVRLHTSQAKQRQHLGHSNRHGWIRFQATLSHHHRRQGLRRRLPRQ